MRPDGIILTEARAERKAIGQFIGMASEQQHVDEHAGNCRLIEAAPELLKAARDLYLLCTPDASIEDMGYRAAHKDEMMERARIVITKAGGKL